MAATKKTTKAASTKKASTAEAPKTASKKSLEVKVILQYGEKSISYDTFIQNAKNVWEFNLGKKPADLKKLDLYIKPEEGKVYFVANDTEESNFDI